ncbi:hypothetical protein [Enterococcus faecium]
MKKIDLINMIGMLIGILVNIVIFTDWLGVLFSNLIPILIIGICGIILSILELFESRNTMNRIFACIILIVNLLPMVYFTVKSTILCKSSTSSKAQCFAL